MYLVFCTVYYYPDQQMHNIYFINILYIVSIATCLNVSASSSGSLNLLLANVTNHQNYNTIKGIY